MIISSSSNNHKNQATFITKQIPHSYSLYSLQVFTTNMIGPKLNGKDYLILLLSFLSIVGTYKKLLTFNTKIHWIYQDQNQVFQVQNRRNSSKKR